MRLSLVKDYARFPLQGILPCLLSCQGGAKKQELATSCLRFCFSYYTLSVSFSTRSFQVHGS